MELVMTVIMICLY